jgi:cysteine-rich repeat protein
MTAYGVHRLRVFGGGASIALFALSGFVACGGEDEGRAPPVVQGKGGSAGSSQGNAGEGAANTGATGGTTGGTSSGDAGESSSAGGGPDGAGGVGANSSGGTTGGGTTGEGGNGVVIPENCGNGTLDEGEDCDGDEVPGDCTDLGFLRGELRCSVTCTYDTAVCFSEERCADALDNDGDDSIDCDDEDCTASCESSCEEPEGITEPVVIQGSNVGHANDFSSSCSFGDESGPEVVYAVEVAQDGVLEVNVTSTLFLSVEIASACGGSGEPRGCGLRATQANVSEGELVYVVVEGVESTDQGNFELSIASRPANVCGDGRRDDGESCDDENLDPLDGCDETCELEATEIEPNGDSATANAFDDPHYAEIRPAGDVDVVRFSVSESPSQIAVNTLNFGDGACSRDLMDSYVEILDESGEVVASDDDGGDGLCARAVAGDVAAGTYFVRVTASPFGSTPVFPYWLAVSVDACGNGTKVETEECDDGNRTNGDGCDSTCREE